MTEAKGRYFYSLGGDEVKTETPSPSLSKAAKMSHAVFWQQKKLKTQNYMNYEVTIGIPVYNVKDRIRVTLESALNQTFESIEFLLCDDCGTDGSIDIIKEYQQSHPRGKDIRIVHQPHNMGIGAARNRLIDEARGRFLFFLDADDTIHKESIELLHGAAEQHKADLVYGSRRHSYLGDGETGAAIYMNPYKVFTTCDEYAWYAYHERMQVQNWNYLILVDILRRNHLRVAEVGHGYGEDYTFTVDLPTYVSRVVLLPDITYEYYIEEDVFHGKRKDKKLSRKQMDLALKAIDDKKRRQGLRRRPWFARRCAMLMMYDYNFARAILSRPGQAEPPYTNREIRDIMWHPMKLLQILGDSDSRGKNLFYWLLGKLPPRLCVMLMRTAMRLK